MTITGAGVNAQSILALLSDRIVLRRCRLVDNDLGDGFVARIDNTNLLCEDTEFSSNIAHSCLSIVESSIEVVRCRFEGNVGTAIRGGGAGEAAIIQDCAFIDNRHECTGGVRVFGDPVIVERSLFVRNVLTGGANCAGGALMTGGSTGRVAFNTFAFDSSEGGGGALQVSNAALMKVVGNTFFGNHAPLGSAVGFSGEPGGEFTGNVVSHSTGGEAMFTQNGGVTGGCNDYWANDGGDFHDWSPAPTDFFQDPLYCDPESLDFTLQQNSPCAEGHTPGCPQVGAWGVGCGSVGVERTTWGRIKGMYRQEEER